MKKLIYEKPTIQVEDLCFEDVILTSGTFIGGGGIETDLDIFGDGSFEFDFDV